MTIDLNCEIEKQKPLILEYYNNKNSQKLIDLYNENKNIFIATMVNICIKSRTSQIPLLNYIDSLNIDININKKFVWRMMIDAKILYVKHYINLFEYDNPQTTLATKIIFQMSMKEEKAYKKYSPILELLLDKISDNIFYEIIKYPLDNNHTKNAYSSIHQIFLDKKLPKKTNKNINIKQTKI